jgi:hypothetical protein
MRASTKGKHEMGKRFALVIGVAAAGVMGLGAQTAIAKKVIVRPNGTKVTYRPMGEVSSNVSLDVFGAIDGQGHAYAFSGNIPRHPEIRGVSFDPEGPSGGGGGAPCSEYRTVTLFRVEPNGTSTRVGSAQTGQGTGGFAGPLERPLGEITGYYYAEVAPVTLKPHRDELYKVGGDPSQPAKPKRSRGAYYRALSCLPARSPTIFVEVPAALLNSQSAQTANCLPTFDRTLGPYGFSGLRIKARAAVYTDALHFAQFQFGGRRLDDPYLVHEADALTSEGFVSGISQAYTGRNSDGFSTVLQLGSPEQAQAELNRQLATNPRRKRFTVAAIPGSQGVLKGGQNEPMKGVRNAWDGVTNMLFFTDGDYFYGISRDDENTRAVVVTHRRALRGTRQVTKAAINLYNRVHGAAVCP